MDLKKYAFLLVDDAVRFANLEELLINFGKPIIATGSSIEWHNFTSPINCIHYLIEAELPQDKLREAESIFEKYQKEHILWQLYLSVATLGWLGLPISLTQLAGIQLEGDIEDIAKAAKDLGLIRETPQGYLLVSDEDVGWLSIKLSYKERLEDELFRIYKNILRGTTNLEFIISILHRLSIKNYRRLAIKLATENNLKELIKGCDDKEDPYKLLTLAKVYSNLNLIDDAIAWLELAKEILPEDRYILHLYGKLLGEIGKFEKAEQIFKELYQREPNNVVVLQAWGVMNIKKDKRSAERLFEEAKRIDSNNIPTVVAYAQLLKEKGEYEKAQMLLDEALMREPDNSYLIHSIGEIKIAKRHYKDAEYWLKTLLIHRIDPYNIPAYLSLACMYKERGNLKMAEELFESIFKIDKENIPTLNSYAELLIEYDKYSEAENMLDILFELDTKNIQGLVTYAKLRRKEKNFEEAEAKLKEARGLELRLSLRCDYIYTEWAELKRVEGDFNEAKRRLYYDFDEERGVLRNPAAYTVFAKIMADQKDIDSARRYLKGALRMDDKNLEVYSTWMDIEAKAKNYQEVERLFHEAKGIDDENGYIYKSYADALKAQGKLKEAKEHFNRAINLGLNLPSIYKEIVNV